MKKFQFLVLSVVVFLAVAGAQSVLHAAEMLYVEGRVQVQSPSDNEWKTAEKGMRLEVGDLVRTARHSFADIALDLEKKNTIRVEEKTLVTLNSSSANTLDRLDLAKGKIYANLEDIKAGLSFEVNTPSAVAGVRGSSYSVYVERDSDEVVAYKDTIYIQTFDADKNLISEIMLPEGFKTLIERFSDATTFTQISSREYRGFDEAMEDLSARAEGRISRQTKGEEGARDPQQAQLDQTKEQQDVIQEVIDTKTTTADNATDEIIDTYRWEEEWYLP